MTGSSALGGLILVFFGHVMSSYRSYPADTSQRILNKYRNIAIGALSVFTVCIVTAALSLSQLIYAISFPNWLIASLFYVSMAGALVIAIFTFKTLMR
jgi:hypothetical protein